MSRTIQHHDLACDVLVAGGGPSGLPAAVAAARLGARVVLVHDRSVLGGNASSEVRMHIMGASIHGGRGKVLELEAREGGIIEEVNLAMAVRNPQRSASMLDLVLYELARAEPNLTLLLDTSLVGVEMSGNRIVAGIAERQISEDRFRITAKQFIDCTGDGRLGAEAGAAHIVGREAKHEHGETLAQDVRDAKHLGCTILFTARKHDRPMPFTAPPWVRHYDPAFFRLRPYAGKGVDLGFEYGYWWCEWGGELDTIKDQPHLRDELLAIVMGIWNHIKNESPPAIREQAANWAFDWFGFLPGKRESRRFFGQHILCERDLLSAATFDDGIAYGGWTIDIHPPEGIDRPDLPPTTHTPVPYLYEIPLRSCVARDVPNLFVAGRCHSATHVAFASTRVMATCAVMGQGVGTAAAYAIQHGMDAGQLAGNAQAVRAIRQRLLRDDCFVIGELNRDPHDLAPQAQVSASSQQALGPAVAVISGQTRSVHGPKGVAPGRCTEGTHRWMSDPAAGPNAWIELRWREAVDVGELQIVFDTGLHRGLALSQSDGAVARMQWGQPQAECVRDYVLLGEVDGAWRELLRINGNWQRLRRHTLPAGTRCTALRVQVTATNGIDHARIVELRCYPPLGPRWVGG